MVLHQKPLAFLFDVFGTAVDWRGTVTRVLNDTARARLNDATTSPPSRLRLKVADMTEERWGEFAQQWRVTYYEYTRSVASDPTMPFKTIDEHHADSLSELLTAWDLSDLYDDAQVHALSLVWHKLDPWPDSAEGVANLNKLAPTSTLSNGNVMLLSDLRAHSNIAFTHILSAEMFGTYKPNSKVYLGACEKLGLSPGDCAMVAAHLGDLKAAKSCGLQTIYVDRPLEEIWNANQVERAKEDGFVDLWITVDEPGFLEVARRVSSLK